MQNKTPAEDQDNDATQRFFREAQMKKSRRKYGFSQVIDMDYRSRFLARKFRFLLSFVSALFVFASCSAEQKHIVGSTTNAPNATSSSDPVAGVGGTIEQTVEALQECSPRQQVQACYCPDGNLNGSQFCDENGQLSFCEGCDEAPILNPEGDLCPDLRTATGCVPKSYVSQKLPSSILFVVDRSGSMNCNTPADGQTSVECENKPVKLFPDRPSKWEIAIQALKESFTSLEGSDASTGLMFFSNDAVCGVNSDLNFGGVPLDLVGASHNALIFTALDNQIPAGGTPLVGATILAYAHLHEKAGGDCPFPPCGAPGNRFVVLMTDGADSCPDPDFDDAPCGPDSIPCTQYLLETEVRKARDVNIRTFVIGAPGSEPARGFLSALAFEGNTPRNGGHCDHSDPNGTTGDCHFDMTNTQNFADDLGQALDDISGKALGCEFSVPEVPDADPEKVNVQYTLPGAEPKCIRQDETLACDQGAQGWQFVRNPDGSRDLSKVVLCGEYCMLIENNTSIQVDVILGCETIFIL